MQDCSNSSAWVMELLQSWTKPSLFNIIVSTVADVRFWNWLFYDGVTLYDLVVV